MKGLHLLLGALALHSSASVQAAPSTWSFQGANQVAFGSSFQSATLSWAHKAADAFSSTLGLTTAKAKGVHGSLEDDEDKSILEIINERDEFRQLAHVLNYSSDATKQLLGSKDKKLTFFAPLNWHREHHHDDDDHDDEGLLDQAAFHHMSQGPASVEHWKHLEAQIADYEQTLSSSTHGDDGGDDEKKRKREIIQHLIDAEAYYHLVRSDEPLDGKRLAENSSVATHLNTGSEHAYNDGTDWRIRTGKSLLPIPAIYLNFYSRVVKPDLKAQNGLIHAIKYPLLLPPDVLQSLFFGQTVFSTSTSGLQKVHAAKYLAYRPFHHHHHHHADESSGHDGKNRTFDGVSAETVFVPTNLAWTRLPFAFRAYLFSPWGYKLLQKVFMLHSLPNDIVYADFVHHIKRSSHHSEAPVRRDATAMVLGGEANKTSYTFDSVLPALKNGTGKGRYETVDVDVYRYYLLPGGKGPLQTRIEVQGVPVIAQDIPASNGVFHAIDRFIKPKGHPHEGLWAEIAREAEVNGFGSVDLERELAANAW